MLDERDDLVSPTRDIVYCQIMAVLAQKMPYRFEGRALVGLLERMCSCNPCHQNDGEGDYVFFAKTKEIPGPR